MNTGFLQGCVNDGNGPKIFHRSFTAIIQGHYVRPFKFNCSATILPFGGLKKKSFEAA